MKVLICLPAYNEERSVGLLLNRINEHLKEASIEHRVIVINDGSTDRTLQVLEEAKKMMDLEIINHKANRGLGDAILTGLRHAIEIGNDRDVVVTMDSDNSHTPGLILRMVRSIAEGNDMVIASRYVPGANVRGVSMLRIVLSYGASLICRLLFPTKNVRDYTSGYRAYQMGILKKAFAAFGDGFISQSGFSCMIDILLKLRSLDAIISEVPLVLRYDMKKGGSKMNVVKTMKESMTLLLKRRSAGDFWSRVF